MQRILTLAASLLLLASVAQAAEPAGKEMKLFNGKNLNGWEAFLVEPGAKMTDVWSVQDGNLVCKGEPMGYLATKRNFKNFKLIVEWRWAPGQKPGNSGVLLRITGKPTMLPNCAEAQLKSGSAGDMYGFQGFKISGPEDRLRKIESKVGGEMTALGKMKANEKKPGEWNRYEITVNEGTISLVVNGEKVNEATNCDVRAGRIGLQSEGGEIHFRTVALTPIGEK